MQIKFFEIRMTFKTIINKEEINALPVETFEGEIVLVENEEVLQSSLNELQKYLVVGIDTETKPSFTKGVRHKVSLVQISTLECCYLFRLNKIGFPTSLSDFLADERIKKVGLSLRDDFNALHKRQKFKPQNFIDLQSIVQNYGILELSLQKIYAIVFGKKISKSQRLTNWENDVLSQQQQRYAAIDAWACLRIYDRISKAETLTPTELKSLITEQHQRKLSLTKGSSNAQQTV